MEIEFIQYLQPNGRKTTITIDRPNEVAAKAQKLREAGYVFEIEILSTGEVSMEVVSAADYEKVIAGKLCPNGPTVPQMVDAMINEAYSTHEHLQKQGS
jgi:hypothetical protein